jgi:hypothetical protein
MEPGIKWDSIIPYLFDSWLMACCTGAAKRLSGRRHEE